MATPIWKSHSVNLGTGISKDFAVRDGNGNIIYEGTAVRPSGTSGQVTTDIGDIASSVMRQAIPEFLSDEGFDAAAEFVKRFTILVGGTSVGTTEYYLNRSGDPTHADTDVIADPIRKVVGKGIPLIYSIVSSGSFRVDLIRDGAIDTTYQITNGKKGQNYYLGDDDWQAGDIVRITEGSIVTDYLVVDECARYALHYVNAFGGWDTLLVNGNVNRKTDAYQRIEYRRIRAANDDAIQDADRAVYANAVTRSWSLTTGWLTDDEASRMHHLLGSRLVYLLDGNGAILYPVIITTQSCEYKRFINDRKPVSYEIGVRLAQDITR